MNSGLVKTQKWIVCVFAVLFAIVPQISQAKFQKVLFGDGNPHNGFEDDRELLSTAKGVYARVPSAVGKIECKQKVVVNGEVKTEILDSSGTLINLGEKDHATVLSTAHNLFDRNGNKFEDCYFLPAGNYHDRVKLHLKNRFYGVNRKIEINDLNDFVFIKVPVELERKYGAMGIGYVEEEKLDKLYEMGLKIELIAFSKKNNGMGISRKECKIIPKKPGDYQYGVNSRSVYLHSCDSSGGSSGGALIASIGDESVILGLHMGTYRAKHLQILDTESYPDTDGLPDGLPFDPKSFAGVSITRENPLFKKVFENLKSGSISL